MTGLAWPAGGRASRVTTTARSPWTDKTGGDVAVIAPRLEPETAPRNPQLAGPDGPVVSDAELVRDSLSDPERFGEVYRRHRADVHGFVARRSGPARDRWLPTS